MRPRSETYVTVCSLGSCLPRPSSSRERTTLTSANSSHGATVSFASWRHIACSFPLQALKLALMPLRAGTLPPRGYPGRRPSFPCFRRAEAGGRSVSAGASSHLVLFSEGPRIRKAQRLLLDVYALFLTRLQGKMPSSGTVWHGEVIQQDGRIRRWAPIAEMGGRYLRVILLSDGKLSTMPFLIGDLRCEDQIFSRD